MPLYSCIISDAEGKTKKIQKVGISEDEVVRSYIGTKNILVQINEIPANTGKRTKRKTQKSVLEFTQMMELLISSGLSLKDSLEVASLIGKKNATGKLANDLMASIRKGISFAKTINEMPSIFSPVYRGIISVGDRVGSVERIFPRLTIYLENKQKLHDKVIGALAYPVLVLIVAILGIIGLVIFVMPKLETIFNSFGGDAAIALQENIQNFKISLLLSLCIIFIILIAIVVLKILSKKNKSLSIFLDKCLLSLPLIGHFMTSWQTLNFAFAMETLTSGGVPVENAIQEACSVISNNAYAYALKEVTEDIMKGIPLSEAFSKHHEFPLYMSQWLIVGERSGKTEQVFSQIRTYFQNEVEQLSEKYMVLIEPILIILIGVFLLSLVISIVIPLFSMYGSLL